MSELKILIHIGHHLNVVNLLGACTKAGGEKFSVNKEQRRKSFQIQRCLGVFAVEFKSHACALNASTNISSSAQSRASATAEYGHHSSMVSEHLLPASGVTSLFSLSLSFVSLCTKGNMDWTEAGSLIAVRCPVSPYRHYWSFQRFFSFFFPALSGGCTRLSTLLLEAPSFPKHFIPVRPMQAVFCGVHRKPEAIQSCMEQQCGLPRGWADTIGCTSYKESAEKCTFKQRTP